MYNGLAGCIFVLDCVIILLLLLNYWTVDMHDTVNHSTEKSAVSEESCKCRGWGWVNFTVPGQLLPCIASALSLPMQCWCISPCISTGQFYSVLLEDWCRF